MFASICCVLTKSQERNRERGREKSDVDQDGYDVMPMEFGIFLHKYRDISSLEMKNREMKKPRTSMRIATIPATTDEARSVPFCIVVHVVEYKS